MKKITYQDIAKKTGISIATISRIVKGNSVVSKEKSQQVLDAMKELGYEIPSDRTLSKEKSNVILVHFSSISNPYYNGIIKGIKQKAYTDGYKVVLHEQVKNLTDSANTTELLELIKESKVAGVISTISLPSAERIQALVPLVQCSEKSSGNSIPYVSIDDVQSACKAVELLIFHGNKKIAIVNGPLFYRYAVDRLKGYETALANAGLEIDPNFVISLSDINYDIAYSAVNQMFSKGKYPDAVFTVSDVIATVVIRIAKQHGLNVPKDVEVVGFDNIDVSRIYTPSITTVSQPCYQMGLNSCEMLIEIIEHGYTAAKSLLLPTELILRESTR
ncbi:MAG: substrate-binding domain-containing protein [Sphaerochaetaceae bacterium]|nr:substrate-binding domain-containing protein [Sphaerochaetaceae bacterium]